MRERREKKCSRNRRLDGRQEERGVRAGIYPPTGCVSGNELESGNWTIFEEAIEDFDVVHVSDCTTCWACGAKACRRLNLPYVANRSKCFCRLCEMCSSSGCITFCTGENAGGAARVMRRPSRKLQSWPARDIE